MQFQVKHEVPPMMRGIMDYISSVKGGNCLDIGLTLATDCPQEKERYAIAASNIPTRYNRGDNDDAEVRSGMKRKPAVSFMENENRALELKNGENDRDLERMGSGMSTLSGCGGDSEGSAEDPRKVSSFHYKSDDPWGVQRIWLGTFNDQAEAVAKPYDLSIPMFRGHNNAIHDFKPAEQDQVAIKVEEDKQEKPEQNGGEDKASREHMFDKAVTPSDVGKLNRLVIPKQHAEKFFPLDTTANEKGLLLNFEDNMGKAWRFRYSYWNSSQSYVLTKGWSRFVKEKKLFAGDIVSFERGIDQNTHRLFISWRRRPVQPSFTDPSKALLPTLPSLTRPHIQYRPFQPHGLNISAAAAVGRQAQIQGTVIPPCSKVFPQWMSLVWPANGGGTSNRAAISDMWPPRRAFAQPHQMDAYFHTQTKSADLTDITRVPLDFMQLDAPERSEGEGTGFDPSTSKKGVRLFGVNL